MRRPLLALSAGLVLLGCQSGATSRARMETGYQRELGLASDHDIRNSLVPILKRYGYDIVRYNPPPEILIESTYRDRYPFPDEEEMGVNAARNRVVISARRVPQRTHMGELFRVNLDVQNQVRIGAGEWNETVRTAQFLEFARKIANDLELAVRSTVRVYER